MTPGQLLTAIVCDDELPKRRAVVQLLAQAGCDLVLEASSLRGLLDLLTECRPDVVVLELAITGSSGLQVVRDLAALDPAPLVIVVSAFPGLRDDALAAGAVALLDVHDLRGLQPALRPLLAPVLAPRQRQGQEDPADAPDTVVRLPSTGEAGSVSTNPAEPYVSSPPIALA